MDVIIKSAERYGILSSYAIATFGILCLAMLTILGYLIYVQFVLPSSYPPIYSYTAESVEAYPVCVGDTSLTFPIEGTSSIDAGQQFIRELTVFYILPDGTQESYPVRKSFLIASGVGNFSSIFTVFELRPFPNKLGKGVYLHGVLLTVEGRTSEPTILIVNYEVMEC